MMSLKIESEFDRHKIKSILLFPMLLFFLLSCSSVKEKKQYYETQIGDTPFNVDLDDANFKFCAPTDVLHKRAYVGYEGGRRALEKEILERYNFKSAYKPYNGYFIIRLAVNCNDEAGRYRMQTLDSKFNLSECPEELEKHILSIVKELKAWKHAFYEGKDYDCYKFLSIKMINGKIK